MDDSDISPTNPKQPLEQQAGAGDGAPRFGILLVILAAAVGLILVITFASAAWYGL
jgi:hypothetical protein